MNVHPMVLTKRFGFLILTLQKLPALATAQKSSPSKANKLALKKHNRAAALIEGWLMSDFTCTRTQVRRVVRDTQHLHARIAAGIVRFDNAHREQVRAAALAAQPKTPRMRAKKVEFEVLLAKMLHDQHFAVYYDKALDRVLNNASRGDYADMIVEDEIHELIDYALADVQELADKAFRAELGILMRRASNKFHGTKNKLVTAVRENTDILLKFELEALIAGASRLYDEAIDCGMHTLQCEALTFCYMQAVIADRMPELGYDTYVMQQKSDGTNKPREISLIVQVPTLDDPTAYTPLEIAQTDLHSDGSKEALFREFADLDDIEVLQELYDGLYADGGDISDDDRAQIEGFALDRLTTLV